MDQLRADRIVVCLGDAAEATLLASLLRTSTSATVTIISDIPVPPTIWSAVHEAYESGDFDDSVLLIVNAMQPNEEVERLLYEFPDLIVAAMSDHDSSVRITQCKVEHLRHQRHFSGLLSLLTSATRQ